MLITLWTILLVEFVLRAICERENPFWRNLIIFRFLGNRSCSFNIICIVARDVIAEKGSRNRQKRVVRRLVSCQLNRRPCEHPGDDLGDWREVHVIALNREKTAFRVMSFRKSSSSSKESLSCQPPLFHGRSESEKSR